MHFNHLSAPWYLAAACSRITMLALIFVLVAGTSSLARNVTLQWDPVVDPNLAGYKIYYSTSPAVLFNGIGTDQKAASVDASTQTQTTITGLDPGQGYYFAAVAYDTASAESAYSNVVSVAEEIPPNPANSSTTDSSLLTIVDALQALQIASGMVRPSSDQLVRLDVAPFIDGKSSPNGKVDTGDVVVILSKLVGNQ